jgi:hypothetical protein
MTAVQLLHDLRRAGVRVGIAGDDPSMLDLDGPEAALTPARLDHLRRHKLDLLAVLRRRDLRRHVAGLIRQARRTRPDLAVSLRDAWRERLAVCAIDGGLTEDHAEQVALDELETMLYSKTRTR